MKIQHFFLFISLLFIPTTCYSYEHSHWIHGKERNNANLSWNSVESIKYQIKSQIEKIEIISSDFQKDTQLSINAIKDDIKLKTNELKEFIIENYENMREDSKTELCKAIELVEMNVVSLKNKIISELRIRVKEIVNHINDISVLTQSMKDDSTASMKEQFSKIEDAFRRMSVEIVHSLNEITDALNTMINELKENECP